MFVQTNHGKLNSLTRLLSVVFQDRKRPFAPYPGDLDMTRAILLKRVDGLELWTAFTETTQHFAVKFGQRRARVLSTLSDAERYFAASLAGVRVARAH
jgi:hypothetical protein